MFDVKEEVTRDWIRLVKLNRAKDELCPHSPRVPGFIQMPKRKPYELFEISLIQSQNQENAQFFLLLYRFSTSLVKA